jgi:hypothetical protein
MTLRWIEGFEGFGGIGTIPANSDIARKYQTWRVATFGDIVTGRGGTGTFAWDTVTTGNPFIQTPALNQAGAIDTIIIGFGFKFAVLPGGDTNMMYIITQYQDYDINIQLSSTGEIVVERRGAELGRSTTANMTATNWYYIEIKIFLDNSTGTVDVKVDESSVLSLTSQDTLFGPTANVTAVRFYGNNNATYHWVFDDIYICDDSGTINNDFLGICEVLPIFPDAAGDSTQWTPDSGSNYARVDEAAADDDTSYVESSTVTNADLYNYGSVSGFATIHGVQINTTLRETDVETFSVYSSCKSGTTTSKGTAIPVGSVVYAHQERILEQDPDTSSAWITAGVNAAQFGVEVG